MKRRGKRLGDEGVTRSRELMRRTERAIERSSEQVRAGDCAGAFDNLVDAGILLGHTEGSLTRAAGVDAGVLVDLDRDLGEVREAFQERCLRRGADARPLTFRRGR